MKTNTDNYNLIADYYAAHRTELCGYVFSRIGHEDVAEDIVQNIFVRLLTTDKMISDVTMPSLVYTTARNMVCDYWRHRRAVEEFEHYIIGNGLYAGIRSSDNPESVYSANEITRMLEHSMSRMSEPQRAVYRMNVFGGMKVGEISTTLQMNYKSVENKLGAARREVREYIRRRMAV